MSVAAAPATAAHSPRDGGQSSRRTLFALAAYFVAAAFDGFDGQVVSFLAPTLARAWHVPVSAFGPVFSLGLLGLMLGGLFLAPLADRYGRRALVVSASCGVAVTMIGAAFCYSLPVLAVWRMLTGLSLGAMMPGLVTVAYEVAPPGRRTMYVTILVSGFPAGGFVGGLLVAWGMSRFSWQALFIGMGLFAFMLALVLAAVVQTSQPVEVHRPRATPAALFREGRAVPTLLTWLLFLATLANVYFMASWLPALLERDGFSPREAVLAAALSNLGGAIGGLTLGWLLSRLDGRVLTYAYFVAAFAVAGLGFVGGAAPAMFMLCIASGFLIPGGHVGNNALAARRYPQAIRATGIGWAQSVGRISSVVAPALVGLGLAHDVRNRTIFLVAALMAVVGALAAAALARQPTPKEEA